MLKLTKKQNETIELIKNREKELGKKLYLTYENGINKRFLIDYVGDEENLKYNIVEQINTKIAYSLLDKNILTSEKINNKLSLVTLNRII